MPGVRNLLIEILEHIKNYQVETKTVREITFDFTNQKDKI